MATRKKGFRVRLLVLAILYQVRVLFLSERKTVVSTLRAVLFLEVRRASLLWNFVEFRWI